MHIPAEMLNGPICPVTAAVTGITLTACGAWVYKRSIDSILEIAKEASGEELHKKAYGSIMQGALKFIGITAIVYVLQALNFPILKDINNPEHFITGHFIGGVLAAAILGIPGGILSMATVLAVQAWHGDGGVDVLGANIINMGIVGAGIGGLIRLGLNKFGLNNLVSTGIAAFCGLMLAVLTLYSELFICGKGTLDVFKALTYAHLPLAVIESFIAAGLYVVLTGALRRPSVRFSAATAAAIVIIGNVLLFYPGKCEDSDGLEWAEEYYIPQSVSQQDQADQTSMPVPVKE